MTGDDLTALADLNLAEATREMARWDAGSEIHESGDLLMVRGGHDFPVGFSNAAMALGTRPPREPKALIEALQPFFRARGRGCTLWIRAHLDDELARVAAEAGLAPVSESPLMVLDAALPVAADPTGSEIRFIANVDGVRDFAEVSAEAYATLGLPTDATAAVFGQPERVLRPGTSIVVAYRDGRPLAAAMAIASHGIAGVYWVGTVPAGQRQGLAAACTRAVSNAAFEAGAACVVLQASQQGEPVYLRMGFREVSRYRWYLAPAATA